MSNRPRLKERVPKQSASRGRVINLGQRATHETPTLTDAENHASLEQLKQTIVAMRQQMENIQVEQQRSAQEALTTANDEIAQLKRTIMAMRDELESKSRKK
jgi:hypothetical protein